MRGSPLVDRFSVASSLVGLVGAIWFAFAPVRQESLEFTLRMEETSETRDTAVAPLAVARQEPDRLSVSIPCGDPGSGFVSARDPDGFELAGVGLQSSPFRLPAFGDPVRMVVGLGGVDVELGSTLLLTSAIDPARECIAHLTYWNGRWDLSVQDHSESAAAAGPWFSEAQVIGPAVSSSVSSVSVHTRELGSSPSGLQIALFMLAISGVIVSMLAAVKATAIRTESVSSGHRWLLRRPVQSVAAVDVAVVVTLLAWLVLLPPQIDEGWIRATSRAYAANGDFMPVYDGVAPAPLGYWLSWIQTAWINLSHWPSLMRLLPLTAGIGIWAGLRSIGRSFDIPGSGGSLWLTAAVYVVGFGAFGMTLRSEPIVMALVTASVAIAVRFDRRPSSRLLAAWAVVAALALSGHPSGVVVLAPLIISSPSVWRWLTSSRSNRMSAIVHGLGLASLTVLLTFMDSNAGIKMESIRTFRSDGQHGFGIFDEKLRYDFLVDHGPAMHRFLVVMLVFAVGALLIRSLSRDRESGFSARTLAVGLLLLALTPSKWFWHFGGLVPIAALAVAVEFRAAQGWRRIVVLGGMVVAMTWVWSDAIPWSEFDLRTQRWWPGATNLVPFDLANPISWIVLVVSVSAITVMVMRWRPTAVIWTSVEATALLAAGLVIAVTAAMFVLDVARTDGWTYGKQSLSELFGSGDCGLGEEVRIPARGSGEEGVLSLSAGSLDTASLTDWIPVSALAADSSADVMITPELLQYFSCLDLPRINDGVVEPPDVMMLTPVIAWQTTFVSAALSDDYYRIPAPVPPRGDDGRLIVIVSHEYLTGTPARATHQFKIDSG